MKDSCMKRNVLIAVNMQCCRKQSELYTSSGLSFKETQYLFFFCPPNMYSSFLVSYIFSLLFYSIVGKSNQLLHTYM